MSNIFHICTSEAWRNAQAGGDYRGDTLSAEGFIHFSFAEQVLRTANRFFRGVPHLVILQVDASKLTSPLRVEDGGDGEKFPHLYGPLNLDSVIEVHQFPWSGQTSFTLPHRIQELLSS